jgi:hypothetical protein
MTAIRVVPSDVLSDILAGLTDRFVGSQIDALVLHGPPDSLDKHVVSPCATTIHRQPCATAQDEVNEFLSGELAALIGVDDVWCAEPVECFLQCLDRMNGLQRDGRPVRQNATAEYVDNRSQDTICSGASKQSTKCAALM